MRAQKAFIGATNFVTETCCECGVEFAITTYLQAERSADHKMFYCPNGHSQYYGGETSEQKRIKELERQLTAEQQRVSEQRSAREWAEQRAKGANIAAGKAKAAKRRLEHRVECGVCPHCQRTFKQLAAHMKSKHAKAAKK